MRCLTVSTYRICSSYVLVGHALCTCLSCLHAVSAMSACDACLRCQRQTQLWPACLQRLLAYYAYICSVSSCSTSLLVTPACVLAARSTCPRQLLALLTGGTCSLYRRTCRTYLRCLPQRLTVVHSLVCSPCLCCLPNKDTVCEPVVPVVPLGSIHAHILIICLFACRARLLYLLTVRVPACGTRLQYSPAMPSCRATGELARCDASACGV